MDRRVGQIRRYGRKLLITRAQEAGFAVEICRYVDSLGFFVTLTYKALG